ncbi:MAG: VTT domain-containing protein [bacterium]|nr:VTT domain-containing protein [bacterium]
MIDIIQDFVNNTVIYLQQFGILFGCFIVILESIIPALPLGVFIAFNIMAFGNVVGFIISWISTCFGCCLSFFVFRKFFSKRIYKHPKLVKINNTLKKISFTNLVLIIALPFSPAFLINIACGISKTSFKKYISAILLGKLSIVYFWGFISKSFLESITDIKTMCILVILLLISYIVSKIVNRKLNIE